MRRVREWLDSPTRLTPAQAELIAAGGYLAGWLLGLGLDAWAKRKAEAAYWDRKFRDLAASVREHGRDVLAEPQGGKKG